LTSAETHRLKRRLRISSRNSVRVLSHPKGSDRLLSPATAEKWVRKGVAVFMDETRTVIRYLGWENRVPFGTLTRGLVPVDPNWSAEQFPTHPQAATRLARCAAERRRRESRMVGCHSESEWLEILSKFEHRCLRCGIRAQDTYRGKLTKDHVVPIASGGTDYASNLQPLCARCNSWKGNREIDFRQCQRLANKTRPSSDKHSAE
jgi:5-methylcytosine-specific restriction endonuclease McrA